MILNILLILFTGMLIFVGTYFFKHRQHNFLFFKPETDSIQANLFKRFGIIFFTMGMLSFACIFIQNAIVTSGMLLLTCIFVLIFNLMIVQFFPK